MSFLFFFFFFLCTEFQILFIGICIWLKSNDFCRFVWDEAKYPTMSPLKEIVDGTHVQIARIEDDLKVSSLFIELMSVVIEVYMT